MQNYRFTAYDQAGARRQGEIAALTLDSARFKLKAQGLIPVRLEPPAAAYRQNWRAYLGIAPRPGLSDIELFTSQMALLLKNGIKIDRALDTSRRAVSNRFMQQVVEKLYEDVRSGAPLSQALQHHPDIFDALYVSITSIGEAGGSLPTAFEALASGLAFRKAVARKTREAMTYPAIIFSVCLLAIFFIFNFIVPRFEGLFGAMAELPFYTEMLLQATQFFNRYQIFLLPGAVVVWLLLRRLRRQRFWQHRLDAFWLVLPLIGGLVRTLENLRFVSAMALLLNSGVLLADALTHAVNAVNNEVLRRQLSTLRREIKQGGRFSHLMKQSAFLPEIYTGVMEVGEQSGNLAAVFSDLEVRFQNTYESRLNTLMTLIEPAIILIMGVVVGTVVVVMLLSMMAVQDIAM